jgi:hypothetical protein
MGAFLASAGTLVAVLTAVLAVYSRPAVLTDDENTLGDW